VSSTAIDDPCVFLVAAHARAEELARAAREAEFMQCGVWEPRGPYGDGQDRGNIRSELREDIFQDAELRWEFVHHMALHHPVAVLRRVAAERELLAEHADEGARECRVCAPIDWVAEERPGRYRYPADFPCRTMLLLAKGWGWTDENGEGA
jgi:hypothetical protein